PLNVAGREPMQFVQETEEHQTISERVDPSRNPTCAPVERLQRGRFELGIVLPSDMAKAMEEVRSGLGGGKWSKVIAGDHTLAQLLEIRPRNEFAKLRLADEKALERRSAADLEIGKHTEFFESAHGEVLGLVDNEKRASSREMARFKELLQSQ